MFLEINLKIDFRQKKQNFGQKSRKFIEERLLRDKICFLQILNIFLIFFVLGKITTLC